MVALPDFEREFTHAPYDFHDTSMQPEVDPRGFDIGRAILVLCGSALVFSSAGLWLVSADGTDAPMMMIKLLFSVTFLFSGLLCLSRVRTEEQEPEIRVDVLNRKLHVIEPACGARTARAVVHDIDSLSELAMRDRVLTARDASGRQVVAMKVEDRATARALCRALAFPR